MSNEVGTSEIKASPRRGRPPLGSLNDGQLVPSIERIEQRQYDDAIQSQEVKDVLFSHEGVQLRLDSISRKLCGGSTAVTVEDLAHWETELSNTKIALQNLVNDNPILVRHPVFAAVADRDN
jgi:hypothetical protein